MTDQATTEFNCGYCGHRLTWTTDTKQEDVITCGGCSKSVGTLNDLILVHNEKMRQLAARLTEKLRNSLK